MALLPDGSQVVSIKVQNTPDGPVKTVITRKGAKVRAYRSPFIKGRKRGRAGFEDMRSLNNDFNALFKS